MRRTLFVLSMVFPVLLIGWGAWRTSFPLGVSGEWEWQRIDLSEPFLWAAIPPALAAICYMGFIWLGSRRLDLCGRWEVRAWVGGLTAATFLWLWVVQESAPEGYQLSKAAWVLYYRGPSGYFSEARAFKGGVRELLQNYEQKMSEGDVLHIGTHPPGLIVAYRILIAACKDSPALVEMVHGVEPDSVRASFDQLADQTAQTAEALTKEDRGVLWLAALLVQWAGAMTVLPLFAIIQRGFGPKPAWLATSLWAAVPAVAIFCPKSDVIYAVLGLTFVWCWLSACDRDSLVRAGAAGIVFWCGMFFSLAFAPMAVFLAVWTAVEWRFPRKVQSPTLEAENRNDATPPAQKFRSLAKLSAFAVAGFLIPCLLVYIFTDMNLAGVWAKNYRNHAGFYHQFPRTYWKWLLINPLELSIASGLPVVILGLWGWRDAFARGHGVLSAALITWAALWLIGKNQGEVARLWIFTMPWFILLAAPRLSESPEMTPEAKVSPLPNPMAMWGIALVCQMLVELLLVTRITGFHYP